MSSFMFSIEAIRNYLGTRGPATPTGSYGSAGPWSGFGVLMAHVELPGFVSNLGIAKEPAGFGTGSCQGRRNGTCMGGSLEEASPSLFQESCTETSEPKALSPAARLGGFVSQIGAGIGTGAASTR